MIMVMFPVARGLRTDRIVGRERDSQRFMQSRVPPRKTSTALLETMLKDHMFIFAKPAKDATSKMEALRMHGWMSIQLNGDWTVGEGRAKA